LVSCVTFFFIQQKKGDSMEDMTEKEQATALIDKYTELQRIKVATDKDKEVDYQIRVVCAKLQALGITMEDLKL
jgi:hypothetical protein